MSIDSEIDVQPRRKTDRSNLVPGLLVAAVAVAFALGFRLAFPGVSPMLSALLFGIVLANAGLVHSVGWDRMAPGLAFASKQLLRAGIVLLGFQIVLGDILGLGAGMIALVAAIVSLGIASTLVLGVALRVPANQRVLIACGFSICGAAAVSAASDAIDAEDEDVAAGIALVALFGTAMIAIIPALGSVFGLSDVQIGMWAGGSIHEVAQVVAVGGSIGSAALAVAVLVKLARVLMLAPVVAALSLWQRSQATEARIRPQIVPVFVAGFFAMAVVRTTGYLPDWSVQAAGTVQLWLLTAAMFAIGCGCRFSIMKKLGWRPVALGALSTLMVASISYGGIVLLH